MHPLMKNTETKLMEQVLTRMLFPGDASSIDQETQAQISRLASSMVQGATHPPPPAAQQPTWEHVHQHAVQQQQDVLAALLQATLQQQQHAMVAPHYPPSQPLPQHVMQHLMQAMTQQGQQVPPLWQGGQAGYGMMPPEMPAPQVGGRSPQNTNKPAKR